MCVCRTGGENRFEGSEAVDRSEGPPHLRYYRTVCKGSGMQSCLLLVGKELTPRQKAGFIVLSSIQGHQNSPGCSPDTFDPFLRFELAVSC